MRLLHIIGLLLALAGAAAPVVADPSRDREPPLRIMVAVPAGAEPTGTSPGQLAAITAADLARWAPIIKAAGFSAE